MTIFTKYKISQRLTLTVAALIFSGHLAADDVVGPAQRAAVLSKAKALLSAKDGTLSVKDPFHSEAFAETLAANSGVGTVKTPADSTTTGPRSNRDLLQAIATSLKPRYLEMGGQAILFFGQKRVKAGDSLTINFEGTDFTLEVVSIERPNFTLRLNRDEFTRPIK